MAANTEVKTKELQYVMVSFDGSKNLNMWKSILKNGKRFNARFTFFVSGVYFLSEDNKYTYQAPGRKAGQSAIGFGGPTNSVEERVNYLLQAMDAGHEISSHANGHYAGGQTTWKGKTTGLNWSANMWYDELDNFLNFLWNVYDNNQIKVNSKNINSWHRLLQTQLKGFRAPNLSVNSGLFEALGETYEVSNYDQNYTYDSSSAKRITVASKNKNNLWNFPLGYINIAGTKKRTIAMDYNFYVVDSKAKPDKKNADSYEERYYQSLATYFNKSYKKTGAPLFIGNHFSTWNKGAYYKGLMRFIDDVCSLADVRCITMAEYADIIEEQHNSELEIDNKDDSDDVWISKFLSTSKNRTEFSRNEAVLIEKPILPIQDINPYANHRDHSATSNSDEIPINCTSESHIENVELEHLHLDF